MLQPLIGVTGGPLMATDGLVEPLMAKPSYLRGRCIAKYNDKRIRTEVL